MVSECLQQKSSSEGEATKDCNTLETLPAASQVALWREACEDALSEASLLLDFKGFPTFFSTLATSFLASSPMSWSGLEGDISEDSALSVLPGNLCLILREALLKAPADGSGTS